MANWCNARLIVVGRACDARRFRRLIHARPSSLFRSDMLAGESQELFSEKAGNLSQGRLSKRYLFQIRSDDGLLHFRGVSRLYPALKFVLVFGFDNDYGSYFISQGRVRSYSIPATQAERVMEKHGACDIPDDQWPFEPEIDAEAELMDLAEAHWHKFL